MSDVLSTSRLFDKDIKIELFNDIKAKNATDTISMRDATGKNPMPGVKPNIGIQAKMGGSDVLSNVQIRIVNFFPSLPLSEYRWIRVTAGYFGSLDRAILEGEIKVAYQEKPSPDGVTLISMLTGNATDVFNTIYTCYFGAGSTLDQILNDIVRGLNRTSNAGWVLKNNLPPLNLDMSFDANGAIKDVLNQLKNQFKFMYLVEGNSLVVYSPKLGRPNDAVVNLNFMSSPPQQAASGITLVAPWLPSLRPGMIVKVDPKFYKQNYGAAQITLQKTLVAQTIEINFNTVTNQNSMTVLALNTDEIT